MWHAHIMNTPLWIRGQFQVQKGKPSYETGSHTWEEQTLLAGQWMGTRQEAGAAAALKPWEFAFSQKKSKCKHKSTNLGIVSYAKKLSLQFSLVISFIPLDVKLSSFYCKIRGFFLLNFVQYKVMRTAELLAHKDSVQISVLRDDKILARLLAGKKKKTLPVEHTIVTVNTRG